MPNPCMTFAVALEISKLNSEAAVWDGSEEVLSLFGVTVGNVLLSETAFDRYP